jgi:hypothetical protein
MKIAIINETKILGFSMKERKRKNNDNFRNKGGKADASFGR